MSPYRRLMAASHDTHVKAASNLQREGVTTLFTPTPHPSIDKEKKDVEEHACKRARMDEEGVEAPGASVCRCGYA